MFPLSVFLLTVFGLSLCFSCPRHPQEDPKPLAVPGIISSMFIDVEDSLGYWEIPEAHCSPVVSPSAFTKWLLLTEHSWRGFGQGRMSQGIAQKKEICKLFSVSCRLETRANENNNKRKSWQLCRWVVLFCVLQRSRVKGVEKTRWYQSGFLHKFKISFEVWLEERWGKRGWKWVISVGLGQPVGLPVRESLRVMR